MNIDKILKEMDTEQGKQKRIEAAQKLIAKQNMLDEKAKRLVSNSEYMNWLNKITIEKPSVSPEGFLSCPEKISDKDKALVEQLPLLYQGIEDYAERNYIYPTPYGFGGFYKIRFNGVGYEVGMITGQGTVFFCTRVEIQNENEFIDFNDIMNNKEQDNVKEIKEKIDNLSQMITSLCEAGVPYEAIKQTLEAKLYEIQSEIDNKK